MIAIFLYVAQHSLLSDILTWASLVILLIALIFLLIWQRRMGRELAYEVQQLEKVKDHNVLNEFVLKALRVGTWHIDVSTMELNYDNDFRGCTNEWVADVSVANGPLDTIVGMLHEQDGPRVARSLQDICEGKTDEYHEEYRVRIPNTDKMYWEESFATVAERGVDGKPTVIVGTSKRIDNRKSMEKALMEARYKAEESDRLKTAFLANMSHEIRTPLNAIVGFTSVLPDIAEAEERKMLIDLINENTQKLLTIVDDVVSISKVESGKEDLVSSAFDLPVSLNEVVDLFMPKVSSGVTLSTKFAMPSLTITTDRSRLVDVMRHLLSNSVKFTSQGSIVVGFDAPADGSLRIWVRDTGIGIAPENHEKIFERFFKVDEFVPGAGLGLSTCRTLAYSMGASVTVESELGKGSTFYFNIPL